MAIQLDQLSLPELQALSSGLQKEFKAREASIYKDARAEVREIERKYGLTIEDILSGKKKSSATSSETKSPVAAKYRNPENTEQTWTGRGKKPKWVESALAQGKSIEEFLV